MPGLSARLPGLLIILALLASSLVAFPATVGATSFMVTECGDAAGATNTLRGRIAAANADPGEPHTITFNLPPDCSQITLTVGQLTLTSNITIQGPGDLAVSGGGVSRVFFVAAGVTATISGLTVTGGRDTYGGGVHNVGTLEITHSTLSGNSSVLAGGGGVYNQGTLKITHSTFTGNNASGLSGGGGVYNTGTLETTHSTFTGNNASGVSGGGVVNVGTLTLAASIMAGNSAINGPDVNGAVTDGGYNLLGSSGGYIGIAHDVNGNIVGGNADLQPLAANGGPTWTHALGGASEAIDHIPASECAVTSDQRGAARPQGDGCDIGAFEVYVQTFFQACLFAGSLSQVRDVGHGAPGPLSCGRGSEVLLLAGGNPLDNSFDDDLHACLYAGSLSQVSEDGPPANCGRGVPVSVKSGAGLDACLYAGRLAQVGSSSPSCSRGVPVALALAI